MMERISENFSYREFEASAIADKKGICNVIPSSEVRNAIEALVLNVLQPLRDNWGKPLHINSGYRCPELNREVGGKLTSQHLKGEAADVACDKPVELARLAAAMCLPYDQMIIYPTFVHFSHRIHGQQRAQILYSKTYTGDKV